jgi:hypothetical protein
MRYVNANDTGKTYHHRKSIRKRVPDIPRCSEVRVPDGGVEKYCLECSADVATAMVLSTEIDAATMNGRSANALVSEFAEISSRMLVRAQSA